MQIRYEVPPSSALDSPCVGASGSSKSFVPCLPYHAPQQRGAVLPHIPYLDTKRRATIWVFPFVFRVAMPGRNPLDAIRIFLSRDTVYSNQGGRARDIRRALTSQSVPSHLIHI